MKLPVLAAALLATFTVAQQAQAMAIIVDGGALDAILDSITQDGSTSIDVNDDQFLQGDDWQVSGSGGSIGTSVDTEGDDGGNNDAIVNRAAVLGGDLLNNNNLVFGVYDHAAPTNRVPLFVQGDPEGAQYIMQIMLDGSVKINFVDTGTDFAANRFGFYLTDGDTTRFSDWDLNPNMNVHAVFFAGNGDVLQIGAFAPGPFAPGEWIIAWEFGELDEGEGEYNDFVVLLESITPVPEPGSLAMLGLGLLAIGSVLYIRRRQGH